MAAKPLLPEIFDNFDILEALFGETAHAGPGAPADPVALIGAVGAVNLSLADLPVQAAAAPGRPDGGETASVLEIDGAPAAGATGPGDAAAITLPDWAPANQKPDGTPGGGGKKNTTDTSDPELAATYTSGAADGSDGLGTDFFNVDVQFYGTWDYDMMQAFATAADFLSEVITAGLRDDSGAWNTFSTSSNSFTVDDVLIEAYLPEIDGVNNILGRAGPYSVRDPGTADQYTTVVGLMEFDVADADALFADNAWDAVVLHEMIHVLGLGSLWDFWGVTERTQIAGQDTRKPTDDVFTEVYTGAAGTAVYAQDKDAGDPDQLQVETDGGSGTAGAHWDDETYGTELMTGYLNPGLPYLEDWTIASLNDIGYTTADYTDPGTATNRLHDGIDLEAETAVNAFAIVDDTLITDLPIG